MLQVRQSLDHTWARRVCAMVAFAAVAWLISLLFKAPFGKSDFQYTWLAGRLWSQHQNPYSLFFIDESKRLFGQDHPLSFWVYPFQWFLPTTFFAQFPPQPAFYAWIVFASALAIASGALAIRSAAALDLPIRPWAVRLCVGFVATVTAFSFLLRMGALVALPIFGCALIINGVCRGRLAPLIIGSALAVLKPQIGIPFTFGLVFMLSRRELFTVAGGAIALTLLLCMPASFAVSPQEQLADLIGNLTNNYARVPVNTPAYMHGLPNILAGFGLDLPITASTALACAAVALFLAIARIAAGEGGPDSRVAYVFSTITATITFVSLHPGDLSLALLLLPFLSALHPFARWMALAGFALLWRPENLADVLWTAFPGMPLPDVPTVAAILICGAWGVQLGGRRHARREVCPTA